VPTTPRHAAHLLPLLAVLLGPFHAQATVDVGSTATFLGFTGAAQDHALVYEASVHAEAGEGQLYAVPMSERAERRDSVTIPPAAEDTSQDAPPRQAALAQLRRALAAGDHGAAFRSWLTLLPAQRRTHHGTGFVPASKATALHPVPVDTPSPPRHIDLALGHGATLRVEATSLNSFAAAQPYDMQHEVECLRWGAAREPIPLCTGCETRRLRSHGVDARVVVCEAAGTYRKPPKGSRDLTPPGKPCDCRDTGYLVVPRLRVGGCSVLGLAVLVWGGLMNERPYYVV